MNRLLRVAQLPLAVSLIACGAPVDEATSVSAVSGDDVILEWNEIMISTTGTQNPFNQARLAAITQLAVFEAVNAITDDYDPYLGTLSAPWWASTEAAAITAAHDVLVNYFPGEAANLDAARDSSLAEIPDGQAKQKGIEVGQAAAAEMIALRANDGAGPPQFYTAPPPAPGVWQPTPSCPPAGGVLFHWQNVTPFGIASSSQFRSAPPPSLGSWSYASDYNEVKLVGDVDSQYRPQDREDVAVFYNVALAAWVFNSAARQIIDSRYLTITESARAFALLNMAISDGLVSSIETKYHYAFWRPETAIHAGDTDGNRRTRADSSYAPFITTPCFPSYPSAHASGSYAGRRILQDLFGNWGHSITFTHPSVPGVTLHYWKLSQITDDIDDARIFGGIHFEFDQEAGGIQGTRIGSEVLDSNLR